VNQAATEGKIRITNNGQSSLEFDESSFKLGGEHNLDFEITEIDDCKTVSPKSDCIVNIIFIPRDVGERLAILETSYYSKYPEIIPAKYYEIIPGSKYRKSIELSGEGIAPQLSLGVLNGDELVDLERNKLEFGERKVGDTSQCIYGSAVDLRIANSGTDNLEIGDIYLQGDSQDVRLQTGVIDTGNLEVDESGCWDLEANGQEFLILEDSCGSLILGVSSGCEIRILFTPLAQGLRRARLIIDSDSYKEVQPISLEGRGIAVGWLSLENSQIEFGDQEVNPELESFEPPIKKLTISNTGLEALEFLEPLVISGLNRENFAIKADACSDNILIPNAVCNLEIEFMPSQPEDMSAQVTIETDAENNNNLELSLRGTGIAPNISSNPGNLEFSKNEVGTLSTRPISLMNQGNAPLRISRVEILNGQDFSVREDTNTCSSRPVMPESSCQIEVEFKPSGRGKHIDSLNLISNALEAELAIRLEGFGTQAVVRFEPESVDFGNVEVGIESDSKSVVINNNGDAVLKIQNIEINNPSFKVINSCNEGIEPKGNCEIYISFTPRDKTNESGVLTVISNAPATRESFRLSGKGVQAKIRQPISPLNFDQVKVGESSATKIFTIYNDGDATLKISSVLVEFDNNGNFSITRNCVGNIPPGEACRVSVRFTPKSLQAHSGTVIIDNNSDTRSVRVSLFGTGI
jgi:uncharacterized membrane protein